MESNIFDLDFSRWEILCLSFIPALINLGIFIYVSFFLTGNQAKFSFSIFVLMLALWQVSDGLMKMSNSATIAYQWLNLSVLFFLFVLPFGILFITDYSNPNKRKSYTKIFYVHFLPSIIIMFLIFTGLVKYDIVWSDQWFWNAPPQQNLINSVVYSWISIQAIWMMILLWKSYVDERKLGKVQMLVLLLGYLTPLFLGLTFEVFFPLILKAEVIPLTTAGITLFSIAALIAIKRYNMLDYNPANQWNTILEAMSEGLVIVNKRDEIMYANKTFCNMMGYKTNEIMGKAANALFYDKAELNSWLRSEKAQDPDLPLNQYEIQLNTKSGDKIWVSMSSAPYYDNKGNAIGTIGIQTNINKLKRAEKRFRALVENADDIICLSDSQGRLIYISPAIERISGYSIQELMGQSIDFVLDPDQDSETESQLAELLNNPGKTFPRLQQIRHKAGHKIWLEGTVINLLDDVNVEALVSNYRDISEYKETREKIAQNERRYRALIENGADAVAILDVSGKPIYVSASIQNILGYSEEEIFQKDLELITHPEDFEGVKQAMSNSMRNPGISVPGYTGRLLHGNGEWRWFESTLTNMIHDESIGGIINNFRDVTDRILAERTREFDNNNLFALINNTNALEWSVDLQFKLITSNTKFNEFFKNYTGKSIMAGQSVMSEGFSKEDLDKFKTYYKRAFLGEAFTEIIYNSIPEESWSEISFFPIRLGEDIIGTACHSNDITKRILADRKIKESEAFNRGVLNSLHSNIAVIDYSGKIVAVNDAWNKFSISNGGLKIGETGVGANYYDVCRQSAESGDEIAAKVLDGLKQVMNEKSPIFYIEYPCHSEDEKRWFGLRVIKFGNDEDKLVLSHHDISERIKSEEIVTSSESHLAEAQRLAKMGSWNYNLIKQELEWSDELYNLFGSDKSQFKEQKGSYLHLVKAEYREKLQSNFNLTKETGLPYTIEYIIQTSTNTSKYIRENGYGKTDDTGKVIKLFGICQDITAEKHAETEIKEINERYELAALASKDVLWDWDVETGEIYRSDNYNNDFGYPPSRENVNNDSWLNSIHNDDRDRVMRSLFEKIDDPMADIWETEYRFHTYNGDLVFIKDNGHIVRDVNGKALRMVGAMSNITDQKNAELHLQKLLNLTKEQNDRLQNFSFIVSHNIRSHSANIKGLLNLFSESRDEEELTEFFRMMKTSTDKLGETIENLNDIITIQSDNSKNRVSMDLRTELEKTCDAINVVISQTGAVVENTVPFNTKVNAVPSYLESILLNILTNAIKYRAVDKQPQILISSEIRDKFTVLKVKDNGIGIDMQKNSSKLFGMYKTFTHNKDARGIGLFITKNQIESMGGKIEVESELGYGSTFSVYFLNVETEIDKKLPEYDSKLMSVQ